MRDLPPNMTDYLATRSTFRLEVPEVYNYARDVVDAWAAKEPAKLALLAVGPDGGDARRFSSADLAASSNRAARFLASLGLGKGDPVFVMLPRIPEWYDVVLGCIKLGAVPMPGTILLTARDIDYRLERAGARVAVTDPEGADKVDQAAKRMGVDLTRILVRSQEAGGPSSGWASWEDGLESASDQPPAVEPTRSDDPILVYFTSGTVAYATVGFLHHAVYLDGCSARWMSVAAGLLGTLGLPDGSGHVRLRGRSAIGHQAEVIFSPEPSATSARNSAILAPVRDVCATTHSNVFRAVSQFIDSPPSSRAGDDGFKEGKSFRPLRVTSACVSFPSGPSLDISRRPSTMPTDLG